MTEEIDHIEDFEAKKTSRTLPLGWLLLFWGLILFGIYYVAAYTPSIGGWSQERAYTDSLKP
jgi:hypothetical protein